jgi:hypothetical protein
MKWLRTLLSELGFEQQCTDIKQDNQGCVAIAQGQTKSNRVKHIDIKHRFITENIESGILKTPWICSNDMLADFFTKILPAPRFLKLRSLLNILSSDEYQSKEAVGNAYLFIHVNPLL